MLALQGDSLIDGFRQLYAEFAPLPERIATTSFTTVIDAIDDPVMADLRAWPNPTRDGSVRVESGQPLGDYVLIDATGRTVETGQCTQSVLRLNLPSRGQYVLRTAQGTMTLLRD